MYIKVNLTYSCHNSNRSKVIKQSGVKCNHVKFNVVLIGIIWGCIIKTEIEKFTPYISWKLQGLYLNSYNLLFFQITNWFINRY